MFILDSLKSSPCHSVHSEVLGFASFKLWCDRHLPSFVFIKDKLHHAIAYPLQYPLLQLHFPLQRSRHLYPAGWRNSMAIGQIILRAKRSRLPISSFISLTISLMTCRCLYISRLLHNTTEPTLIDDYQRVIQPSRSAPVHIMLFLSIVDIWSLETLETHSRFFRLHPWLCYCRAGYLPRFVVLKKNINIT